jgi:excisionase family DNA binding protein
MHGPDTEKLARSIANTAAVLDVGKTTVYGLLKAKKLEAVKVGARTLVLDASIQRLLTTQPPACGSDAECPRSVVRSTDAEVGAVPFGGPPAPSSSDTPAQSPMCSGIQQNAVGLAPPPGAPGRAARARLARNRRTQFDGTEP